MFSKELDRYLSIRDVGLSGHKVVVVGDLMLDRYLWGSVRRISPEAPVPVVRLVRQTEMAGGAGNVVRNLAGLGLGVTVGGCIGDDVEGDHLLKALDMVGVDASAVVRLADRPTITKSRIVGEHQQMLRLDVESLDVLPTTAHESILKAVAGQIEARPARSCSPTTTRGS